MSNRSLYALVFGVGLVWGLFGFVLGAATASPGHQVTTGVVIWSQCGRWAELTVHADAEVTLLDSENPATPEDDAVILALPDNHLFSIQVPCAHQNQKEAQSIVDYRLRAAAAYR